MTAIAHWVWDDFASPLPFRSRIGVGSGIVTANTASKFTTTYMNRQRHSQPAKVVQGSAGVAMFGVNLDQWTDASDCLVPMPGGVRSFECILRYLDSGVVDFILATSNDELSKFGVELDDNAHLLVNLLSPIGGQVTLDVDVTADLHTNGFYDHVVAVVDLTGTPTLKAYVNGALQGTDSAAINLSEWTPTIFEDTRNIFSTFSDFGGFAGRGGWCEMMVHDAELTAEQILQRSFYMRACNAQE